jgi:SAM-dependent methyltransferase
VSAQRRCVLAFSGGLDTSVAVRWLHEDLLSWQPERRYALWHDRAVFHFLTSPEDRVAYVRQVARAVKPGGHVIVATFGPEGPTKCSDLDVVRYGADALHDEFGSGFQLVKHLTELHQTPAGSIQQFTYCYCNISSKA